ncbi:MAG TPA: NTP transferase domain-containing protein [Caulobacteraceae bacterium]|nr:NTP transferase domain-containing protein [Caulobacteraceae bacterium]
MRCVVIAAGQGSRLRAIARSKPLATVLGVPLIERVILAALAGGATEFVVVTGYEAQILETFLAELSARRGLEIATVRNDDWRLANGLSVVAAAPAAGERFLLLMSDHLFDPEIVQALIASDAPERGLTLAIDRRLENPLVDLEDVTRVQTGSDGVIRHIGKRIEPYDAFDTGVFLATPMLIQAILDDVAAGGSGGLSNGVQRLADQGLARTFDIGARFWLDVDDAVAFGHAEREQARLAG